MPLPERQPHAREDGVTSRANREAKDGSRRIRAAGAESPALELPAGLATHCAACARPPLRQLQRPAPRRRSHLPRGRLRRGRPARARARPAGGGVREASGERLAGLPSVFARVGGHVEEQRHLPRRLPQDDPASALASNALACTTLATVTTPASTRACTDGTRCACGRASPRSATAGSRGSTTTRSSSAGSLTTCSASWKGAWRGATSATLIISHRFGPRSSAPPRRAPRSFAKTLRSVSPLAFVAAITCSGFATIEQICVKKSVASAAPAHLPCCGGRRRAIGQPLGSASAVAARGERNGRMRPGRGRTFSHSCTSNCIWCTLSFAGATS